MNILEIFENYVKMLLDNSGLFYSIILLLLIVVESILPVLPLALFIAVSFRYFGIPLGFLFSYIFTLVGSFISYFIFRSKFKYKFKYYNKYKHKLSYFKDLPLERLTMLISLPFSPAFLINILAGLSNMDFKKYLISMLIGKLFLIFFWGFLGYSLIDSITNIKNLLIISIIILIAYIISKIINKKYDI